MNPFHFFNKIYYRWLKPTVKDSKRYKALIIRKNFRAENAEGMI
jgi:hypothetical protein